MALPRPKRSAWIAPRSRNGSDGLGKLFAPAAAVALVVALLLCGFSWLMLGEGCTNGEHARESPGYVVCEVVFEASRNQGGRGASGESTHALHAAGTLLFFLPVLIVLSGIIISLLRRRAGAFWVSLALAPIPIALMWLALVLLAL
jgi:hypothetical protein